MELLIVIALACWGGGRYLVHTPERIAERRQRATHTHQLRMARLAARQGPTITQAISTRLAQRIANPRGGPAREAIALWWADSWGYATAKRLRRNERRQDLTEKGQLFRQRAARHTKKWVRDQWNDLTAPTTTRGDEPVQAHTTVSSHTGNDDDIVDAEIVDDTRTSNTTDEQETNPATHNDTAPNDTADENSADDDTTTDTAVNDTAVNDTAATTDSDGDGDGDGGEGHMASVHPLHTDSNTNTTNTHTNRKDFTVTTPASTTISSGETLDPAAARAFTCGVEEAAHQIYSQIELSVTSLTGCGVSGEPIADLTAIQEAFSVAIDRCRSATEHFDRHLATQDQLLSDPSLAATVTDTYVGRM